MKIYVASSWRNEYQPFVVQEARFLGHSVFDFRKPATGNHGIEVTLPNGFHWSEIDPGWQEWDAATYWRHIEESPLAQEGYRQDMAGMQWADLCLMVMPCGRSAHLELGWSSGAGKMTAIYYPDGVSVEPELMAKMADHSIVGESNLVSFLQDLEVEE